MESNSGSEVKGPDEMVDTWRNLTENQRRVIKALAKETDPENFDQLKELAREADSEDLDRLKEYIAKAADVHPPYISLVVGQYLDVIEALNSGSLTIDDFSPDN